MMQSGGPLAIMGGAFDPVHYGHLRTAYEIYTRLQLSEVRLIPSSNPPHRPPHHASNAWRLQMLEAAVAGMEWCSVDDRELRREGPSWSVVTLEELRAESGDHSLCMILGMDAYLGLPDWHRWEEVLGLAHLVVAHRPGWVPATEGLSGELISSFGTSDLELLRAKPSGCIVLQEVTQLEIASSAIRVLVRSGSDPRYLLPDNVLDIITATGCYAGEPV